MQNKSTLKGLSNDRYKSLEQTILYYLKSSNKNLKNVLNIGEYHQNGNDYNIFSELDTQGVDVLIEDSNSIIREFSLRAAKTNLYFRVDREIVSYSKYSRKKLDCEFNKMLIKKDNNNLTDYLYLKINENDYTLYYINKNNLKNIIDFISDNKTNKNYTKVVTDKITDKVANNIDKKFINGTSEATLFYLPDDIFLKNSRELFTVLKKDLETFIELNNYEVFYEKNDNINNNYYTRVLRIKENNIIKTVILNIDKTVNKNVYKIK